MSNASQYSAEEIEQRNFKEPWDCLDLAALRGMQHEFFWLCFLYVPLVVKET